MTKNIRASVAMAVYNGEKYLKEQIDSILPLLSDYDELVISYDKSSDNTLSIILEYRKNNPNIRVFKNKMGKGVSYNFTNAAVHCRGKYILFSDQDDIWLDDKVNVMVRTLEESGADLAIHDGLLTDKYLTPNSKTLNELNNATVNPLRNFIKGRFLGCCMAFRRETMKYVLPFPAVTSDFPHDIFATIMVGIKGKIVLVPKVLIMHRLHEGNETPKTRNPLYVIMYKRMILLFQIVKRLLRKTGFKKYA